MKPFFYFLLLAILFSFDYQLQGQCNGVSESDSLELVKFYEALGGDDWTDNSGWLVEPVKEWKGVFLSVDGCNVERLGSYYNKLKGKLFDINLPNLLELRIESTELIGNLIDFTKLPNLERLILYNNELSGDIPNFSNIPNLTTLNLSHNKFNGAIPNFLYLPNLESLNLSNNFLNGFIPNFSQISNLQALNLSRNELTGNISDFSQLPILQFLSLRENQLSGNIPNFSQLPNLERLHLGYNNLGGNIPNFINLSQLIILELEGNQLINDIPNFEKLLKLINLLLNHNQLSGTIPEFDKSPKLEYINLSHNNLFGDVPNFSGLPNLRTLNLAHNELTGNIPTFANLTELNSIYLSNNKLTGTIPDFSHISFLRLLILNHNELTGTIPNFLNLENLNTLYINNNKLSGYIPDFSSLKSLYVVNLCPNNLIGSIPNFENSPFFNFEESDFSCIQTPILTGTAYHDLNQNCLQDEGEEPLKNTKITVNDSLYTTFTDENGFYTLQLDTGTYQITATSPNFLWSQNCPENSYTVTFENYTDTIPNQNFGYTIEDECTLLTIDVASPLQRRCFKNTYTVSYCNEGTRTADNPFIELTFPDELIPLDASIPYSQDGNVLSFDLEALAIGACGSFTVTDSVNCEAVLGSTACVEGRIYPAFLCRDVDSLWDGSDIVVEGECMENEYIEFTLTNEGEDMQDSIEYRIYENDVLSALHKLQLMEGESTQLSIAATGATYRLKAAQTAFHPLESQPQVVVELCGDAPYALGFVTSQPNSDLEHFIDIDCQEIIGSFDPNDKSVHPTGIAAQHYIEEGTELTYKIRFQNTGNDTAFRVTIIDTLQSEFLDLQTFKITNTSHSYDVRITDRNVLIVEFNNILLPDSTTNELESHGFVQYKITPFQDAPKKSIITNLGDIYFDYNQPITTNTVFNTIGIPELDVTLPIELLQFNAYLDHHQNAQLTWITASEINNSHFEVQRSSNGKDFEAIGKMAGKGTSSELHSYRFEDSNLPTNTSTVYFRLKQTDFNGQFTHSKVIALSLQNEHSVKVWYNAAQNSIEVMAVEVGELQIFDAVGRLVRSVGIIEGKQTIDLQGLKKGVYAYRLLQGSSLEGMQVGKLLVGN